MKAYMKYRTLPGTQLNVSEVCLGTMTFGGKGRFQVIGNLGQEPVDQLMKRAMNLISTSYITGTATSWR